MVKTNSINKKEGCKMLLHMGLDVGSTTVKLVALDDEEKIVFSTYRRHFSDMKKTVSDIMETVHDKFSGDDTTMNVTGSGGIAVAELLNIPFVQEVVAGTEAITHYIPCLLYTSDAADDCCRV